MLAKSVWPRAGYDLGNRSRVAVEGPIKGQVVNIVRLPESPTPRPAGLESYGGIAVAEDGSLRVARAGLLAAVSPQGDVLWSHVLREGSAIAALHSAPVALDNNSTLLTLERSYIIIDAAGKFRRQSAWEEFDDSGFSPNLTQDGELIATSVEGDVAIAVGNDWAQVGSYGVDLVPPAVYSDGSLAISGFSGLGFCRVRLDGTMVWATGFRDADLIATINSEQIAAVGALNEQVSRFFDAAGEEIGEYGLPAVFAEYSNGEWIARSENYIARLTAEGDAIWEEIIIGSDRWSKLAPIVDSAGRIYVADAEGVHCFDRAGHTLFTVETDATPASLALVAPGMLACLVDRDLLLIS